MNDHEKKTQTEDLSRERFALGWPMLFKPWQSMARLGREVRRRVHDRLAKAQHPDGGGSSILTCGTLRYTPAGIVMLFAWLLWGDFTFTLMEAEPALLVMQLKDYHVSNSTMAILLGTIATVCSIVLNPAISFYSDRYRSPWGRRRPFLMVASPLAVVFLIFIPWAPQITERLMTIGWARSFLTLFPATPLVLVFGFLIVGFRIFNAFLITLYFYLIPDVVPKPLIGRFSGCFRVVGISAGMLFNLFVFGHAHAHMRFIFAFFGLLYLASFVLMCWKVREGDYPEIKEEHGAWYSPIKNYATECYGHARYWLIFLIWSCIMQWAVSANMFAIFFYRDEVGLTETEFGRLTATAGGINLLLAVPFGILVDRLGSQRTMMIGFVAGILVNAAGALCIHSRSTALVLGLLPAIPAFLIILTLGKFLVDMYPRAQFGQFGSAGALVASAGSLFLIPLVGKAIDSLGNYYRLCLIVPAVFYSLALLGSIVLYRWPAPKEYEKAVPGGRLPVRGERV